jgi:Bax protein
MYFSVIYDKGHMKKLIVISVCFMASLVGAAFIPVMISGVNTTPSSQPDKRPIIEYYCMKKLPVQLLELDDVDKRKQCLIDTLLPLILKSNESIIQQRATVEKLKMSLPWLTPEDRRTMYALAETYMVERGPDDQMIRELLKRVDVLPVSLILAQAAIETGWGSSRFGFEGNNVFGLRSLTSCGIVPKDRDRKETYSVSVFNDLQSCIDYYMWTINTHPKYDELRRIRSMSLRPLDSIALSRGLKYYSEMGGAYVKRVEEIISYNGLQSYDDYRLHLSLKLQG